MSPDLIENGGIRVTLRAHVVCGHCTEFADYNREDTRQVGMFGPEAQAHFEQAGWSFLPGYKVRCPTCVNTKRKAKRK